MPNNWPPLEVDVIDASQITDLGSVTLRGDIRAYAWDGGSDLSGGADPDATAGFFLDSSAGAAQFQNIFAEGGSFTNVTIEGDIRSANWNGSIPANLASEDGGATSGYYLDSSVGSAQFEGDLWVGGDIALSGSMTVAGNITLTGSGVFRTASSGSRIDITTSDISTVHLYLTGFTTSAEVRVIDIGGIGILQLKAPDTSGTTRPTIWLQSNDIAEYDSNRHIFRPSDGLSTMVEISSSQVLLADGSAGAPSLSNLGGDTDTGVYFSADDQLSLAAGGVELLRLTESTNDQVFLVQAGSATVPSLSWASDSNTGFSNSVADRIDFIGGGTLGALINSNGIQVASGSEGSPSLSFHQDSNTGFYQTADTINLSTGGTRRAAWNQGEAVFFSSSGAELMRWNNSDLATQIYDTYDAIGDVEVLRADRNAVGSTTEIGYHSSWTTDATGKKVKVNQQPLAGSNRYWQREWFMDIEPIGYKRLPTARQRKRNKALIASGGYPAQQIEMGFTIENLIEHTNYLTVGGDAVGNSPSELALLAVTVDYVQHLERRVAELEAKLVA